MLIRTTNTITKKERKNIYIKEKPKPLVRPKENLPKDLNTLNLEQGQQKGKRKSPKANTFLLSKVINA